MVILLWVISYYYSRNNCYSNIVLVNGGKPRKMEGTPHHALSYYSSMVAIVTPTDRPKSVRSRYVTKVLGGVSVLSSCFLDFFFCRCRGFVIGLSQISSFFSYHLI